MNCSLLVFYRLLDHVFGTQPSSKEQKTKPTFTSHCSNPNSRTPSFQMISVTSPSLSHHVILTIYPDRSVGLYPRATWGTIPSHADGQLALTFPGAGTNRPTAARPRSLAQITHSDRSLRSLTQIAHSDRSLRSLTQISHSDRSLRSLTLITHSDLSLRSLTQISHSDLSLRSLTQIAHSDHSLRSLTLISHSDRSLRSLTQIAHPARRPGSA